MATRGGVDRVRMRGGGLGGGTSAATGNAPPPATAPSNTAAPTVSGNTPVGSQLTTTNGTWSGNPTPTYTYQWQRAGTNISGATSQTYTTVAADAGNAITSVVTATNSAGSASATSSNSITPVAAPAVTTAPSISGNTYTGSSQNGTSGAYTNSPTITRQWQSSPDNTTWTNISGATNLNYVLQTAQENLYYRMQEVATNAAGSVTSNSNVLQAFSPKQISGLVRWYDTSDASTITLNSTTISNIADKSGTGSAGSTDATQPTASRQGTYTQPVTAPFPANSGALLSGTAQDFNYDGTAVVGTSYTILNTHSHASVSATQWVLGGTQSSANRNLQLQLQTNGTGYIYGQYSNDVTGTSTIAANTPKCLVGRLNTASGRSFWINGTSVGTSTNTTALLSNTGGRWGSFNGANTMNGYLKEMCQWNVALTDAQAATVSAWQASKWATA